MHWAGVLDLCRWRHERSGFQCHAAFWTLALSVLLDFGMHWTRVRNICLSFAMGNGWRCRGEVFFGACLKFRRAVFAAEVVSLSTIVERGRGCVWVYGHAAHRVFCQGRCVAAAGGVDHVKAILFLIHS